MDTKEKDWKLFRKLLPDWQEAYMERLVQEYLELLNSDKQASDKFWALEKRIREDKRSTGVRLDDISRSKLQTILAGLVLDDVISEEDLQDFSDELRDSVGAWLQVYRSNYDV